LATLAVTKATELFGWSSPKFATSSRAQELLLQVTYEQSATAWAGLVIKVQPKAPFKLVATAE